LKDSGFRIWDKEHVKVVMRPFERRRTRQDKTRQDEIGRGEKTRDEKILSGSITSFNDRKARPESPSTRNIQANDIKPEMLLPSTN
jgi:hypothetical protein